MWVKICGNTNLEDAALAVKLGADAVGFVFAESKRQVTPEQVATITPHLPAAVERVGVFYSHDAQEIALAATVAGLTAVQLHGGLDEELIASLTKHFAGRVRIIQTLHWTVDAAGAASAAALKGQIARVAALGTVARVLVDSKVGAAGGGTGVAFDWAAARILFASAPTGLKLIVAGGLRPDNVANAIAQLGPWGVDVASGVEESPRRKSPEKLAHFLENARGAKTP
ncbi:MAG TPA: phosphoribosylanthranilate isomerase [Acidobacteriaceae bacterium]